MLSEYTPADLADNDLGHLLETHHDNNMNTDTESDSDLVIVRKTSGLPKSTMTTCEVEEVTMTRTITFGASPATVSKVKDGPTFVDKALSRSDTPALKAASKPGIPNSPQDDFNHDPLFHRRTSGDTSIRSSTSTNLKLSRASTIPLNAAKKLVLKGATTAGSFVNERVCSWDAVVINIDRALTAVGAMTKAAVAPSTPKRKVSDSDKALKSAKRQPDAENGDEAKEEEVEFFVDGNLQVWGQEEAGERKT
ncbi:hypothetical protein BDV95DRAFT_612026 [Massariosphaeria phaeospora]|uniref:Uncharacterized protein n=1 Tax=Massariosphaeria phaeospora TaxID=100035 RepID=A0A7C8HZE7_9PLEO|nr:hypothetical protein BDV95DRAFT_612026 [Massariosphaeria phaeospora]